MPTLLCHIVWMPSYAGENDVHAGGFDYVREEGYGHELFNFMPFDGFCYGYVEAHGGTVNIDRLGADEDDTFFDNVTVIWTAAPPGGERVIVGWYHGARVYRNLQVGSLRGREVQGRKVGYYARARAKDSVLVPAELRDFRVPHHGRGLPGQSSVFYPEGKPEMQVWLGSATHYIFTLTGNAVAERSGATGLGWPSTPDAAHNAAVEAAAIAFVRSRLGEEKRDRQKDNCGWDLEFTRSGRSLCVEVKGLSGSALSVELSPNEYVAMKRAMTGGFAEGEYQLAVVRNALTTPELFLFAHAGGTDFMCELTSKNIRVTERVAARLSENL
ncbi:MAG: protein NO VEIN domain-containing protein [Chthoniobacterales bacterium]